jgi:carbamoyl-phosphate synthase small subunit
LRPESPAVLLLEDGTIFRGYAIGARGTTVGELCFNTGLTGYQEIYTDPSYKGQILISTHTHIGNYGVIPVDSESASIKIAGLVVRNFSPMQSRADASGTLQDFLTVQNTVGIGGIDTRALVQHIREKGAMNGIISSELTDNLEALKGQLAECPSMEGLHLTPVVSTAQAYTLGEATAQHHVAVLDYGVKLNILNSLLSRDCRLTVLPYNSTQADVLAHKPSGILLSNGPGDPAAMDAEVDVIRQLLETEIPIFGICLGNQLLARSQGIETFKMPFGHRGLNHAVLNLETNRAEITSQNHGFAVSAESAAACPTAKVTHINLNDQTVEGIRVLGKRAFAVQYHPESNPGPHDSRYLFDDFVGTLA